MAKNLTPSVIKIFSLYKDLAITHVLLLLLCITLTWASLDILNSIDAVKNHESKTKEISINLKDSTSPIIALENSNSNLVYVLMPMRV